MLTFFLLVSGSPNRQPAAPARSKIDGYLKEGVTRAFVSEGPLRCGLVGSRCGV
jgi:hypothetical protein